MSALTEGWAGVWPTMAMVGAFAAIAGGLLTLLGTIAGIVGNEPLADRLLPVGAPIAVGGVTVSIIGLAGWAAIITVAGLAGFGWMVRPR